MLITAIPTSAETVLPFRERFRAEVGCQIVHDSIHRREGWTVVYLLQMDGVDGGYGSVAIGGPWKDNPTIFEFYLPPEYGSFAFAAFEAFLAASQAQFFEVQSNEVLLTAMLHAYGREIVSEKIVFKDLGTTHLPAQGAVLIQITPDHDIHLSQFRRQGGGEWSLEFEGQQIGTGGILFHYNPPYGDIYMEIAEPFRRRGFGAYLVQELKRECRRLGGIPGARCNTTNVASRQTLQKAGFVPSSHMLLGMVKGAS